MLLIQHRWYNPQEQRNYFSVQLYYLEYNNFLIKFFQSAFFFLFSASLFLICKSLKINKFDRHRDLLLKFYFILFFYITFFIELNQFYIFITF